jgi:hypothetical protein
MKNHVFWAPEPRGQKMAFFVGFGPLLERKNPRKSPILCRPLSHKGRIFLSIFHLFLCFFFIFSFTLFLSPLAILYYQAIGKPSPALRGHSSLPTKRISPVAPSYFTVMRRSDRLRHLRLSSDSSTTNKVDCHPVAPTFFACWSRRRG